MCSIDVRLVHIKKLLVTRVLLGLELDHLLAHLETEIGEGQELDLKLELVLDRQLELDLKLEPDLETDYRHERKVCARK